SAQPIISRNSDMNPATCLSRLSAALSGLLLVCCAWAQAPVEYGYRVLEQRAHAEHLFTQGLLLRGDTFYESGGRYGQSRLVSYSRTGGAEEFILNKALPREYFAEG